jgi:poly [ADP-ribose] polymerase
MHKHTGYLDVNRAIKEFEKKFKDKTKNNWADRGKFKPVSGKYTMIEMAGEEDDDDDDEPDVRFSIN